MRLQVIPSPGELLQHAHTKSTKATHSVMTLKIEYALNHYLMSQTNY